MRRRLQILLEKGAQTTITRKNAIAAMVASTPSASQSATAGGAHGSHLIPMGQQQPQGNYLGNCPITGSSPYYENYCYYITAGTSFSQGWCESQVNDCGYLTPGNWYWKSCHTNQ